MNRHFSKDEINANGQQIHEKMLRIMKKQENMKKIHNEVSPHFG